MNLKELAKNYGIEVNEDSCPIHIFKELDSSIEKKYKVGQIILPYCKYEDCEHCWQIELQEPKEEWIAEITEINNEIWSSDIEGNTKEEVIKEGIKYSKSEGITSFRVGQKIPVSIPSIDVEEIINNAYNQVYDEVGECAEGFLDDVPEEQEKELENQLNDVFYNWIKKYKLEPNCYNVINDEVIEVEETNKDCTCKLTMMELDKPNKNCNYVKAGAFNE